MYDKIVGNVDVEVIVAHEIGSDVLNKISKWLGKKIWSQKSEVYCKD